MTNIAVKTIKTELAKAGVPTWAMDVIDGPDGKEVSVSWDILEDMADPAIIEGMKSEATDKGLCFPA